MSNTRPRYPGIKCSFCGKGPDEVTKLITGPSVHICNECVDMCNEILREDRVAPAGEITLETLPTPREMKAFIDQYVIGQDDAKMGVCVAAYNHYKRLL